MSLTAADLAADRRLAILRTLKCQPDHTLNSAMLQDVIKHYGHVVTRAIVHADLAWLREQALLAEVTPMGSVHVARASAKGVDVADGLEIVPGVRRPGPAARAMGRKSKVRRLPPELRDELERLLDDDRLTLAQITAHLRQLGADVSQTSVWRFSQHHKELRQRLGAVREVANQPVGDPAEEADGKQTRSIAEMLQALLYRFAMNATLKENDDDPDSIGDIQSLARAFRNLAGARKVSTDLRLRLREELAAQLDGALKEAEAAGEKGLSAGRLAELRREFLGVRDTPA